MKNQNTKKLAYAALFLALCLVLPMLTGQIPQIGSMLLPMHIPVLLCGLVCGWQYGAAGGFVGALLGAGARSCSGCLRCIRWLLRWPLSC